MSVKADKRAAYLALAEKIIQTRGGSEMTAAAGRKNHEVSDRTACGKSKKGKTSRAKSAGN